MSENTDKRSVIGVNKRCSNLFLENTFPTVFSANKAVIVHKITVIALFGKSIAIVFACTKIVNRKKQLMLMETSSKRSISRSDFNRPPQTMVYGITFATTKT